MEVRRIRTERRSRTFSYGRTRFGEQHDRSDASRYTGKRNCDNIETYVQNLLEEIQKNIFQKALDHRTEKTITVDTYEEFKEKIEEGYFIMAHWDGTPETEEQVKNETKATIRCIPLDGDKTPGKCMVTGKPSAQRVLFARAY